MIFTREQWQAVYYKYRGSNYENVIRPPDLILEILEQDALEHGIHQSWIDFWNNPNSPDAQKRWANTLHVLLNYHPSEFAGMSWGKPRD